MKLTILLLLLLTILYGFIEQAADNAEHETQPVSYLNGSNE